MQFMPLSLVALSRLTLSLRSAPALSISHHEQPRQGHPSRDDADARPPPDAAALLAHSSFEVTPRSYARYVASGGQIPPGSTVFVAHIAGTGFDEVLSTACDLRRNGANPVPHLPARLFSTHNQLQDCLMAYRDQADVRRVLVIAGGVRQAAGSFQSSMDLVVTGLFDRLGFQALSFAGHPEGSRDIDPRGGTANVDAALRWKHAFAQRSDIAPSLVTQFVFDAAPVITWAERIRAAGITFPIHVGLAGPASLKDLIRHGVDCGIGPSIGVLRRRALDLRHLLRPVTPDQIVADLVAHRDKTPDTLIAGLHFFPFGSLADCLSWRANSLIEDHHDG